MRKRTNGTPTLGPERRFAAFDGIEIRAAEDNADSIGFTGHAAVFGKRTWIGPPKWGFWEEVRDGAFTKTIAEADVRMLKNHDPNLELARSTITSGPGSLVLSEDREGLKTVAEMIPTSYARDLEISLRSKVISQMSFSFQPVKEEWTTDDNGDEVRTLVEVKLYDVSPVTFPAYTETDAALRAVGMDLLMESIDISDDQRMRLVSAIRRGHMPADLAPVLRAASQALAELAQRHEPDSSTREEDTDPATAAANERIERQMRAIAVMAAEW